MKSYLLILVFISLNLWANKPIPGLIPRFYSIPAASDLEVSAAIAHELAVNNKEDISLISPLKNTNLWNPENNHITLNNVLSSKVVRFKSILSSRVGKIRITVQDDKNGYVNLVLSKKIHNTLLKKNLLEKIGFNIPKMSWQDQVQIQFDSKIDKELFIEEMKDELIAETSRWIIEEGDDYLILNDILAIEAKTNIYDLTLGVMPREIHRERRLLKAPYIAISLVDTPESVNLFSWEAARIILDQVQMNHTQDVAMSYNTSYEDARWISRKIAKLTREDWEEIVDKAFYPLEVKKLMVEKIISRRNDLMKVFNINDAQTIEFDSNINQGEALVKGEITQEFFQGYVARFSYGDPVSPFSNTEIGYYVLSRVQSEAFSQAIKQINKLISTDNQNLINEKVNDLITKEGIFFPTQGVVVPSVSGNIILSRNIVTGSYLGTNNAVQIADNIGIGLSLGALKAVIGLPYELGVNFKAGVSLQRTFSHIKPIESLKKAMKEPYKNMLIPMVLKDIGKNINKLSNINSENQDFLIASIVNDLKAVLNVGESFIISDSIGPSFSAQANLSISKMMSLPKNLLKVYASVDSQKVFLARFHIHRPDNDTLQIYQDDGESLKLSLSLRISAYAPILAVNARWNKARATTEYYPIDLKTSSMTIQTLKALRTVFIKQTAKELREIQKPHLIEHKFLEKANTLKFLFFKRNKIGSNHSIVFTHRDDHTPINLVRRYDSITTGRDIENFSVETINEVVSSIVKKDYSIEASTSMNAGFTIAGRAQNTILESEFDGNYFHTTYRRVFNGWKANKRKLGQLVKKLNREFGSDLIDPLAYSKTDSILLYQIQMNSTIDHVGIQNIINTSEDDIKSIFLSYPLNYSDVQGAQDLADRLTSDFTDIKELIKDDPTKMLVKWHKLLRDLASIFDYQDIMKMAGNENILTTGRIDGFREGDEAGDSSIVADVYGKLDLRLQPSPTQSIMSSIKILQGELLLSWIGERAL